MKLTTFSIIGTSLLFLLGGRAALAQAQASDPAAHRGMTDTSGQNKELADQITELRAQVARLQAAVQQTQPGKKANAKPGMNMSPAAGKGMGMMGEGEMGKMPMGGNAPMAPGMSMGDDKDEMGGMPMGGKSAAMPAPAAAMGMCCMGKGASAGNANMSAMPADTGGMASMNGPASAMPGQAGASHIYHIGSNGFFLNHSRHITLTPDQKLTLNHLKEKAMLESAYEQRRIDQAEQELYTATGADQPDNTKIQAKIGEIEKLRSGQRMNFIRAVADASNVLTPEQRKVLLGTMASSQK